MPKALKFDKSRVLVMSYVEIEALVRFVCIYVNRKFCGKKFANALGHYREGEGEVAVFSTKRWDCSPQPLAMKLKGAGGI